MDHSHLAVARASTAVDVTAPTAPRPSRAGAGWRPAKRHRCSGAWVPSDSYLGSLVESSASRLNQATLTSIPVSTPSNWLLTTTIFCIARERRVEDRMPSSRRY